MNKMQKKHNIITVALNFLRSIRYIILWSGKTVFLIVCFGSIIFFNCGIIALQCCVSFCCMTTWINCKYISLPSCASLPPMPRSHPSRSSQSVKPSTCVIEQLPSGYLFDTQHCVCVNATLSIYPSLSLSRCVHKSAFLHQCLYSCSAKRWFIIISPDAIYH